MKKTNRAISLKPQAGEEPDANLRPKTQDADILGAVETLANLIGQTADTKTKSTRKKKNQLPAELEKLQEIEKDWDKTLSLFNDFLPLVEDVKPGSKKENVVSFRERKPSNVAPKNNPKDLENFGEKFFEGAKNLRLEEIKTRIENADSPEELYTFHKIALHLRDLVRDRIKSVSSIEPKGEVTFGESRKPKDTGDGHYLIIGMQWKDKEDKRHHQSLNLERILSGEFLPAKHSPHLKPSPKPSLRKR